MESESEVSVSNVQMQIALINCVGIASEEAVIKGLCNKGADRLEIIRAIKRGVKVGLIFRSGSNLCLPLDTLTGLPLTR